MRRSMVSAIAEEISSRSSLACGVILTLNGPWVGELCGFDSTPLPHRCPENVRDQSSKDAHGPVALGPGLLRDRAPISRGRALSQRATFLGLSPGVPGAHALLFQTAQTH